MGAVTSRSFVTGMPGYGPSQVFNLAAALPPPITLGTLLTCNDGCVMQFVKFTATVTVPSAIRALPVTIDNNFLAVASGAGYIDGFLETQLSANTSSSFPSYAWVVVEGDVAADTATGGTAPNPFKRLATASQVVQAATPATDGGKGRFVTTEASNSSIVRFSR